MASEPKRPGLVSDGKVEFHYQKTSQYRGVHADGFWGGPTPRGILAISFFSERQPIPRRAYREVASSSSGTVDLGEEVITEVLPGIVRQVESTVYMDFKTAQEFYVWFRQQVVAMETYFKVPTDQRVTNGEE